MLAAISSWPNLLTSSGVFVLLNLLAAIPWLYAIDPLGFRAGVRKAGVLGTVIGIALLATVSLAAFMYYKNDPGTLEYYGRMFGSILQLQIAVDIPILILGFVLVVWPRGGTVALAAFRESYRQPMFWLLVVATSGLLFFSMVIPYFTFGDDFKMMKQLSLDMVMLATVLFCILAASMSIHEEIEGRTAVTLMSKPVTRRQFLLGKYLGILIAGGLMTMLLGWVMNWALIIKPYFDRLDDATDPLVVQIQNLVTPIAQHLAAGEEGKAFFKGAASWFGETGANGLCLALGFGQVMVLLAVAASLATRLPMVVNLVLCLVLYFLGHLAPSLVEVTEKLRQTSGGIPIELANFLAQLIDKVLPSLAFFSNSYAIIRETPLDAGAFAVYVCTVLGYAAIYTVIALLVGLILFEDRDLA